MGLGLREIKGQKGFRIEDFKVFVVKAGREGGSGLKMFPTGIFDLMLFGCMMVYARQKPAFRV